MIKLKHIHFYITLQELLPCVLVVGVKVRVRTYNISPFIYSVGLTILLKHIAIPLIRYFRFTRIPYIWKHL